MFVFYFFYFLIIFILDLLDFCCRYHHTIAIILITVIFLSLTLIHATLFCVTVLIFLQALLPLFIVFSPVTLIVFFKTPFQAAKFQTFKHLINVELTFIHEPVQHFQKLISLHIFKFHILHQISFFMSPFFQSIISVLLLVSSRHSRPLSKVNFASQKFRTQYF